MAEPALSPGAKSDTQTDGGSNALLEKFVQVISGMIPALENIKLTIEESSGKIPKASDQLTNVTQATETATVEILNVLDSMAQNVADAESGLKKLAALLGNAGQPVAETMASIARSLATTKEKSMNIAMALQVQDITTQQIAGVSHMIESVRLELAHILEQFGDPTGAQETPLRGQPRHFDIDAQFTTSPHRQEQADQIIEQWTNQHHE
jgi:chemotaxis regulatin CheY-phosphate phosphatase CheZ